jgi:hypothetical protein
LASTYDGVIELVAVELVADDALLAGCRQPVTVTESVDGVRDCGLCVVVGGGVCAAAARSEAAKNAAVAVANPI